MIEDITSSFHTEALQNSTSMSIIDLASTMMTTNVNLPIIPKRHVTFLSQAVLTLVYITGVIGNVSALVILFHRDKRRNRKHLLMLRCLATNDLVALLGMLVQMYISIYVAGVTSSRGFCSLRVVWRLFGLFSGCVAIVMAAERWLALTRPFVYQKFSIPLAQFSMTLPQKMLTLKKCIRIFHVVADILLCIHFTLDPYIYVLLRMPRPRFRILKPLCRICWPARSRSNSFTGTGDNHFSSGDPPTPITEAPSTPVSEEHESELAAVNV
ncbi:hypothetical protein M0802_008027 [Mischocyttarus mexicanus]|nr:hypothetical protein M0802_008027 [Mischocyttarus mexicanus]